MEYVIIDRTKLYFPRVLTAFGTRKEIIMKKTLSKGKVWCFAIGQLGWSILSALISSWLVNYYQPDNATVAQGHSVFVPQGAIFIGLTVVGLITAFGRVFDAVTDPLIASASDRCKSKNGRRIPFMKWAAVPFGIVTALVFFSPMRGSEGSAGLVNALFLFAMVTLFYLFMTMYCTPYNALIAELGSTQSVRMAISTTISFTFIAGMAFAYLAPVIWGTLMGFGLERMLAIRLTMSGLALIGVVCMFVPVFTIKENDYVDIHPSNDSAFRSLAATFKNREFRRFVVSDIVYFLGITMFQTALPFFVTSLLQIDESYSTLFFVLLTALSLVFYPFVGKLTRRFGKKKPVLVAFGIFALAFGYASLLGDTLSFIPRMLQGVILCLIASPAQALFGILPQAMVADIAESEEKTTGVNRSGMFFAARTFAMKMGQGAAMLLVTSLSTIGTETGLGYRIVALSAAAACLIGGAFLLLYNEKKIYARLGLDKNGNAIDQPDTENAGE